MKTKMVFTLVLCLSGASLFLSENALAKVNSGSLTTTTSPISKDGEILDILMVLNKNEIAAANLALDKAISPSVKNYAKMIKKEHTKNLNDTLKLSMAQAIKPKESVKEIALKKAGQTELKHLSSLNAKKFDEAYINPMIKDHQQALKLMDDSLLKNVSNSALKNLLLATKPHLIFHLKQAQKIQRHNNL